MLCEIFAGLGGEAGRELPKLLRQIGIQQPGIEAHVIALKPGHPDLRLPLQFSVALESRLLATLSEDELASLRRDAEAERLQAALADAGIGHIHSKKLAPTSELRRLQYAEDARQGVGKRNRSELAAEYRDRYTREILASADLTALVGRMPSTERALYCASSATRRPATARS